MRLVGYSAKFWRSVKLGCVDIASEWVSKKNLRPARHIIGYREQQNLKLVKFYWLIGLLKRVAPTRTRPREVVIWDQLLIQQQEALISTCTCIASTQ